MKKQIFKRSHFLMSALALLLIMVISCAKESVQEDGIIEQAQAEEVLIDDKAIEADEDFIAMKNHLDITMELYRTKWKEVLLKIVKLAIIIHFLHLTLHV